MKPSRLSLTALVALAVPAFVLTLTADDALPKAQPATRYEPMAARSPFMAPSVALPTPTPPPQQIGPHWWDQMAVTSLMEAGGTYFAAVVDKANGKHYLLESGKPDQDTQLLLAEVQWNEHSDQSTITVRKGAEVAPPLRFDTSAAAAAPTGPQQPFNAPQHNPAAFNVPALPPNFKAPPPPPPPPTSTVVRRTPPIASRPNSASATQPVPPNGPEMRKVRPLGSRGADED